MKIQIGVLILIQAISAEVYGSEIDPAWSTTTATTTTNKTIPTTTTTASTARSEVDHVSFEETVGNRTVKNFDHADDLQDDDNLEEARDLISFVKNDVARASNALSTTITAASAKTTPTSIAAARRKRRPRKDSDSAEPIPIRDRIITASTTATDTTTTKSSATTTTSSATTTTTSVSTEEEFIGTGTPADRQRLNNFCREHRKYKCTCDCAQWNRNNNESFGTRIKRMAKRYLFIGLNSINNNPEKCLEKSDWQHLYKFTVPVGLWGEMKIGVAITKSQTKEISIWISGSSNIEYFASDNPKLGGKLQDLDNQTLKLFHPFCNESVHVGNLILKGYFAAHRRLGKVLRELKEKYGNDHSILFNGHSIGACVAQMLAISTVRELGWHRCCVQSIGYGNPRCGDQNFAAKLQENVYQPYQFNWLYDPIKDFPSKANDDREAYFDRSRAKSKRTFLHPLSHVVFLYSNDSNISPGDNIENLVLGGCNTDPCPDEPNLMRFTKDWNLLYRNHYGFFEQSDAFLNSTCVNE